MRKFVVLIGLLTLLSACTPSYTVTFETNGGTQLESIKIEEGKTIAVPEIYKEGYTLEGWYTSVNGGINFDERWSFNNNTVKNEITLYAKWNVNQYTITFDIDGGETILPITQNYDSNITVAEPTKEGHTFIGWNPELPSKIPSENIVLRAQWQVNQYDIVFETNGGSEIGPIKKNYNSTINTLPNPIKEGYTFDGWYNDSNVNSPYVFGGMPAENIKLYAKWNINQYTITFDTDGGGVIQSITQNYDSNLSVEDPSKEGHTFIGWNPELPSKVPSENITLKAQWQINQYSITYNNVYLDRIGKIPLRPEEIIIETSLGYRHSSAITSNGRLFTWGYNTFGQLGDETTINRFKITEITAQFDLNEGEKIISIHLGGAHSSAITSNGRVFTWGKNNFGQLGDETFNNRFKPTEITNQFDLNEGEKIISIHLGGDHSLAITSNGRLFTWGDNVVGQLGNSGHRINQTTPIEITDQFDLNEGEKIISIHLGDLHSSALTSIGRVFTWGYNYYGQLGDGTTKNRFKPTEITNQFDLNEGEKINSIHLGSYHSSAITSNGRLFTWGYNLSGQLGNGTRNDQSTPIEITDQFNLEEKETIIRIHLGGTHSSALTSNGRLFTWGNNVVGQLGNLGHRSNQTTPIEITDQFDLNEGETITSIHLGFFHSSVQSSNGSIFSWGSNSFGQVGEGASENQFLPMEITNFKWNINHEQTYNYGSDISEYIPNQSGYTFNGWYLDIFFTKPYSFSTMPAENIILYARWTEND